VPDEPALDLRELDLSARRTVHVVGVGGAGMSAIALLLARMGHRVSGTDLRDSPVLARLAAAGVAVEASQRAANVPADADAVVYSTAVPADNVELAEARRRGIPVLHRSLALRALTRLRSSVAVAGSHGKTTTSSMLALVLRAAGLRPSFVIGGEVNEVGANAAFDAGDWLVVEADESDGTFLALEPAAAIVTSVEPDHLDHYGGFAALVEAFERFLAGVPGPRVVGVDDATAAGIATRVGGATTYGFASGATIRIVDYVGHRAGARFGLERDGAPLGVVELPVPGRHNAANATGAIALAGELGVRFDVAAAALRGFGGVARRFQHRGEVDGVSLVDDYAHLPAEVAAAIAAAREGGWAHVVVVFQPHRYTRTAALWRDFADAFTGADAVVVTDVYAAGEAPVAGVSGELVARAVAERHPGLALTYRPRRVDLLDVPRELAGPGDVVLTLGAGDLTTLPDEWLARRVGGA
jgi:UDP-N-acetylmuramate--alanine ligase